MQIHCKLDSAGQSLLSQAVNQLDLSALTIADLEGEDHILPEHIGEAVVLP
jgi:predicted ATPase with chaperone activity